MAADARLKLISLDMKNLTTNFSTIQLKQFKNFILHGYTFKILCSLWIFFYS